MSVEPPAAESSAASEDAALVLRVRAGAPEAFGTLYERHADRVYRYLCYRCQDPGVAADLTQDAFVNALRHLAELREPERFKSWLMQIAHRRFLNHGQSDARLARRDRSDAIKSEEGEGLLDVADAGREPWQTVDEDLDRQESLARVLAEASRLSEEHQRVLGLRFAADLTIAETAAAMGRSEPAVKQLQHRAILRLRSLLGRAERD